jgi:hypothetical protein
MHVDTQDNDAFHRMNGHGLGLSCRDSPPLKIRAKGAALAAAAELLGNFLVSSYPKRLSPCTFSDNVK